MTQLTQHQLDAIQSEADKFIEMFDIPKGHRPELVNLMTGTLIRTQHAINNGEKPTDELVKAAITHTHESNMKMYNDFIHNVDGCRDRLAEQVYDELKASM